MKKKRPVVVFTKPAKGHPCFCISDEKGALKAFMQIAKEKYNYDIEQQLINKNLPEKGPDMLSSLDLKKEFGGQDAKYTARLSDIYQDPSRNKYISSTGTEKPLVVKVKSINGQPILCIVNHGDALNEFIKILREQYAWDILRVKNDKDIPLVDNTMLSSSALNRLFQISTSKCEDFLNSVYKNTSQNFYIDANGDKQPIIILRRSIRGLSLHPYVANKINALNALLEIAKKQGISFIPREGQQAGLDQLIQTLPLKNKEMFSSADLEKKLGGRADYYANALKAIYAREDKNIYFDSSGKEYPIVIKVQNSLGHVFLCVSNEKGALRRFIKLYGNIVQPGREELRTALYHSPTQTERAKISHILSETNRVRRNLAKKILNYLKNKSQQKDRL